MILYHLKGLWWQFCISIEHNLLTPQCSICKIEHWQWFWTICVFSPFSSRADDFPTIIALGVQLPMNLRFLLSHSTLAKVIITEFESQCLGDIMQNFLEEVCSILFAPVNLPSNKYCDLFCRYHWIQHFLLSSVPTVAKYCWIISSTLIQLLSHVWGNSK